MPQNDVDDPEAPPANPQQQPDPQQADQPVLPRQRPTPIAPPQFNDDRDARLQQVTQQETDAFQQEQKDKPISPSPTSGWTNNEPQVPTNRLRSAYIQSDREIAEQQRQERQQYLQARDAQSDQLHVENDAAEAKMRGSGQQFYRDEEGVVQPVIDQDTKSAALPRVRMGRGN